jgi:16S rRNA (uracil1498-N3)-methyltransferase
MRSLFLSDLIIKDEYIITGQPLHHLVNVVRLEAGEYLLMLNGQGLMIKTKVHVVSKREIRVRRESFEQRTPSERYSLVLGMPKKDALELCLKQATELGFHEIYLVKSDFSQTKFQDEERIFKLIVSALEQSNAPFLPKVFNYSWEQVPTHEFQQVILLDSQTKQENKFDPVSNTLLVVGPEGGFSNRELSYLHTLKNVNIVNLPTPILRTPTALAVGAGIILESLRK